MNFLKFMALSVFLTTATAFANPCQGDAQKICPGLKGGEAASCLMKNRNSLSAECKKFLGLSNSEVESLNNLESDMKNAKNEKIAREEKSKTSMEQITQLKANSEARNKMKETCKKKKEELCGSLNSNVKWKCWKEKKGENCKNYF